MAPSLSTEQSKALFDILTHYNTYQEIRDFRYPGSLEHYGPPFTAEHGRPSSYPALQSLVSRFLLNLPGLNNLTDDFWKIQMHDIILKLESANLSESYDKGAIGSRKTLSTAISSLIEYPIRGTYGGFRKVQDEHKQYDVTNAEDLFRSFRDFLDQCIYGSVLEDLVEKAAKTDQLSEHTPMIKAVHEFVLVNLASFMHYTLVLSPKGQYLLKLIDNANKLVPYMVIRQTLRIGNVATMINAMMKVVLAKVSISTLTNWMGLTQSQNEGMNLMQQIISTVLSWDTAELEKRGSKLEKERAALGKQQFKALKDYTTKSREDQESIRQHSMQNSISIVKAVLESAGVEADLTDPHHKHALEYLNIQLSIRDRKEITQVFCHSQPDYLTQSVKELAAAYDPIIRHMHQAIDLSDTVNDFEKFLKDMLKIARIRSSKDGNTEVPTVADFIQLLRKHQFASHKFIHQCCKNDRELTGWYLDWAKQAAAQFKRDQDATSNDKGAGDLTQPLDEMFSRLPKEKQKKILPVLDAESKYVDSMHNSSLERLAAVLKCPPSKNPQIHKILNQALPGSRSSSRESSPAREPSGDDTDLSPPHVSSDPGPGSYLARWQDLLDNTPITPLTQEGAMKKASSAEVVNNSAVDVDGGQMIELEQEEAKGNKIRPDVKTPNVKLVAEAMAEEFRELLAERTCDW